MLRAYLEGVLGAVMVVVAVMILRDVAAVGRATRTLQSIPFPHVIPISNLTVLGSDQPLEMVVQSTRSFAGGVWHNDDQVLFAANHAHSWVEFAIPPLPDRRCTLEVFFTRAADYGTVQVSVNGAAVGQPIDLWSDGVRPTGPIDVGTFAPAGGLNVIRFEVVGKHALAKAPYYQFGIDGIRIGTADGPATFLTAEPFDRMTPVRDLPVLATSGDFAFVEQDVTAFGTGLWERGDHQIAKNDRENAFVELGLPTEPGRLSQLELFLTRSFDYGIIAVTVDGVRLGAPVDLWAASVRSTGAISFGRFTPKASTARLRVTVVGANQASRPPRYQFGIDGVRLTATN